MASWYNELCVCAHHHRAVNTTQKAHSATSVALDSLGTQAEVVLMTASPAPARTPRPHGGMFTHPPTTHTETHH